eukprot:CAMPEP_0206516886 /NCGR_PEP_ID=MMETSP0324_2-20121206/63620_1 /ASSEMBLY_ACC=CAM_ASM_000836 /TAXON_ID=2866 /ORGANISM="Crypthecodinium cohnii, Strain Seligo" /LENGTH=54 /DNA_ID=CAMNT_0054009877 /DNA_START=32 /DNA_END=192 /DNA_ORIENTATION=+
MAVAAVEVEERMAEEAMKTKNKHKSPLTKVPFERGCRLTLVGGDMASPAVFACR